MYRAVAWFCLDQRVDLANEAAIARAVANVELRFDGRHILCNGRDVSVEIRSAEVSASSSVVAAVPEVRHEMVRLQREAAAGRNMVTEGRDQGSVVFADADCKFFLTADPNERAARRLEELERRGQPGSLDDVLAQIIDRDERDRNRPVGPLVMADDAIEIDSSSRTADEILDLLEATSRERLHKSS